MPSVGFKPTVSAGERPQTYASDRAATGTGPQGVTEKNLPLLSRTLKVKLIEKLFLLNEDSTCLRKVDNVYI